MFYENFSTGGAVSFTLGDTLHDAAILIGDLIVGVAGSPWTQVTGAGPTPVWLQPYASTVSAAASTSGWDKHYTLYLDTDPGLLTKTITCIGTSGTTLRIDIDGTDYDEAWDSDIATTVTSWLATHTATLAGLGTPIVVITGGSAIITASSTSAYVLTDQSVGGDIAFTWSANCVMMRLCVGYFGVVLTIIDTLQANPATTEEWGFVTEGYTGYLISSTNTTTGAGNIDDDSTYLFTFGPSSQRTAEATGAYNIYLWMWDECFAIRCRWTLDNNYLGQVGGAIVWYPAVSGIPALTRSQFPHIWGMTSRFATYSSVWTGNSSLLHGNSNVPYQGWQIILPYFGDIPRAADIRAIDTETTVAYSIQYLPELGHIPHGKTPNGEQIIQRMMFGSSRSNTDYAFFGGVWDEGPRLANLDIFPVRNPGWQTTTIGGVEYFCAAYQDNITYNGLYNCTILFPLSDLTL